MMEFFAYLVGWFVSYRFVRWYYSFDDIVEELMTENYVNSEKSDKVCYFERYKLEAAINNWLIWGTAIWPLFWVSFFLNNKEFKIRKASQWRRNKVEDLKNHLRSQTV